MTDTLYTTDPTQVSMPGQPLPVPAPRRSRTLADTMPRGLPLADTDPRTTAALQAALFPRSGEGGPVPMPALGEANGGFTGPGAIRSMVAQRDGDEPRMAEPGAAARTLMQQADGQPIPLAQVKASPPEGTLIGVARSSPVVARPGEMPAPGAGLPPGIGKNIHRDDLRTGEATEWPVVGNAARLPGQQMMPAAGVLGSPQMEELSTDYLKSLPPKPGAAPVAIPGMSSIGTSAQGDTAAHAAWLRDEMAKLMPKASPMELYRRSGAQPISITYGNYGPGEMLPGDVYQHSRTMSQSGRGGAGGSGGAGSWNASTSGQVSGQEPPRRSGTWYDTPFGFLPNLPNADMMQYQREEQGRQQLLAGLTEAAKSFTPGLQAHAQMQDAALRAASENDKMAQAVLLDPNTTAEQKIATLDALEKQRQARAASIRPPGPWQAGNQNTKTPEEALKESIKNLTPGVDPKELDAALVETGLKSTTSNKLPVINADNIVEALRKHPNMTQSGRLQLLREAMKQGIDPDEFQKAIVDAAIRRTIESQPSHPGDRNILRITAPQQYGQLRVAPLHTQSGGEPSEQGKGSPFGYRVSAPGFSMDRPLDQGPKSLWGGINPFADVMPTMLDSTRKIMTRENEETIAPLLEALQQWKASQQPARP
jgi:hypothetical protein